MLNEEDNTNQIPSTDAIHTKLKEDYDYSNAFSYMRVWPACCTLQID